VLGGISGCSLLMLGDHLHLLPDLAQLILVLANEVMLVVELILGRTQDGRCSSSLTTCSALSRASSRSCASFWATSWR
jgi:hypothetical protein